MLNINTPKLQRHTEFSHSATRWGLIWHYIWNIESVELTKIYNYALQILVLFRSLVLPKKMPATYTRAHNNNKDMQ